MNNVFINCTNSNTDTSNWAQYGVIYLAGNNILKQNKFINSSSKMGLIYNNGFMNAVITFNDVFTDKTTFTLSATITDDVGNTIASARTIKFNVDGMKVGESGSDKGVATLSVSKLFDNGKHEINGNYNGENNTFNPATLTVDIDRTPVEFWVSTSGNDTTGDGSKNNPFNTINHAITAALDKSINITIHIMDGTYLGTGNVNLKYSRIAVLNLIGENYGKTIIDGQDNDYFFYFDKGLDVDIINLTFTNGKAGSNSNWNWGIIYGSSLTMNDCIIKNSTSNSNLLYDIDTQNSKLVFNNLTYINNKGNMWLGYATINNSYFADNVGAALGGVIRGTNNLTVINSKFINNTNPKNSNAEGGAVYAQNIISINNIYDSNYAGTKGGAVYVSGGAKATFINDTFINNRAAGDGGAVYAYISSSSFVPVATFENVKFINNSGANGGAATVSGATFNNVTFKDNTANTMGGAIYLFSVTNGKTSNIPDLTISDDSLFENNNAPEGKDIYISTPVANNGVANVTGLTITFNDLNVAELAGKLTAQVTHPSGAVISGNTVTFFIDGNYAGIADVVNGIATYNYVGFEDGKYSLSGTYDANGKNYIYKNGTITVKINNILDNITVYVSDAKGNDSTADGSLAKPFKTIKNALEYAQSKSRTVTVYVLEGTYTGNLNANLDIQVNTDISIVGDGENKTIIFNPAAKYFITALQGKGSLKIANMTIDRVGKDTQSALYIEKNVHVMIDTVEFINGKGNYGGAINSAGILTIKNSYFFNNGHADPVKRQNAYAGGAIYNDGYLTIDNTTFVANHATRASTIANQGNLYMNNSQIIDSISASSLNMDYRVIASFNVGQIGNITLENTKISVTGKTPLELVNSSNIYQGDRSVTCLGFGSSEKIVFNNVTVDGNGSSTMGSYVFGGFNSWNTVGGGRSQTPKDIYVYNSTFSNLLSVNIFYEKINSTRIFDGCIFDNVEYLVEVTSSTINDAIIIKNSVIYGDAKVGKVNGVNITLNLDNNWWGSNNATYYNAVIRLSSGYNSAITELSKEIATPDNYLVLTLDVTNKPGLLQDAVLAFKVFNGTNLTDYVGSLPVRDFNMSAANVTLSVANGTINNGIVNGFEAKEGNYTISATVDGQTVIYNGTASLGKGIINVTDISLDYGEVVMVNATLVDTDGNGIANINMTLKVNGKTYYMVTDENGAVSFVIDPLDSGNYTLEFIVPASKILSSVSNSSTLTINKAKDFIKADIDAGVAGEDVVIVVNGPKDLKENITVTVDKTNYNLVLVNGSASLTLKDLTAGNYDVTVSYPGDNNYYNQVIKTNFTVDINKKVNLNISDIVMIYKDGTRMVAVLTDYLGNPIANATVYFSINGVTYVRTTDVNGSASIGLNLGSGVYGASVYYNGSDMYDKVSKNITVTVNQGKADLNVNITSGVAGEDVVINVNGPSDITGNVTVVVNDKKYNATFVDGTASVTLKDLASGNYTASVLYSGDKNYEKQELKADFTVDINKKVNLNISDIVMIYKDGTRMVAVLTDYLGNPIANATVYFSINGVTYVRTTDVNGSASIGLNLGSGVYGASVYYNGSDMYDKVSKNITVTINPTVLADDLVKMYKNATKFSAKFTDSTGKALVNSDVRFNINGVFYTRTTDANGVASLAINLRPGDYILTAYNPVNGEQKGFNITVKSLIVQNDLTKYYLNASRFQATIYNKDGSLAVNKNVTFNINGVFYIRTTDSNGVVSLAINLRPGDYIITTIFDGLDIGNKVTVLPTLVTKDLNMKYMDGSNFTAQTLDSQGKALANQNVSFNVNGVFYHRITNEDGIASLRIRLMAGEYIITSYWNNFQTGNTIKISP